MMDNGEYSHALTSEQETIRQTARSFAENEMRPVVMRFDESQEFPFDVVRRLGELGFMGMTWPEELGGSGLSDLEAALVIEELARVDPSIALTVASHNSLCTGHLVLFGTDEQRRRFVPRLASGEALGAWGLTEPGSGSDSGGMKTTARRDGSVWVLNGSKSFITQGSVGSIYVIMAVTDPSHPRESITAFVLEKGMPGFSIGRKENKLGMRCSDTAALLFDNVRVQEDNMIGQIGEGFKQALQVLAGGRIGIAALSVGIAQGALDASLAYAKERKQFGRAIGEFEAIQWKLADMATDITAARLMTWNAALLKTARKPFSLQASEAKYFASEIATRAASEAVQIHGGYGFIKEFPVEKLYRDVKLMTIGEGTSEVQKMVIARNLLAHV
jgi:alkylation response protein AidB-like acyl-CoA dehydrogenase